LNIASLAGCHAVRVSAVFSAAFVISAAVNVQQHISHYKSRIIYPEVYCRQAMHFTHNVHNFLVMISSRASAEKINDLRYPSSHIRYGNFNSLWCD